MPRDIPLVFEPVDGPEGDGRFAAAAGLPLGNTLEGLISDLFAAGLQLQVVLKDIDGDAGPAQRVRAVLLRIDTTITSLRLVGRAESRAADVRDFERAELIRTFGIAPPHVAHAEGILAERLHVPIADAGEALAAYARLHDQHLPDTARGVIDGTVNLSARWD
jgi:hypothetical protein